LIEIWKNIPNYEGLYQISNLGNVKSFPRHGTRTKEERILKQSLDTSGYPQVCLTKNSNKKTWLIHILLGKLFIDNPHNKPEINHKDGIKTNYSLDNLEWNTKKENMIHAVKNGLHTRGESHSSSKLTEKKVLKIRELYASKAYSISKLSNLFSVHIATISDIVRRRYWKFI
jgi:hypothetical protein